ncbi:hypothetical protein ON010_g278 [Phytophthora cinnamomi]|nr:hypothetical protein ON010_g278 [Phytophthora cinnamomi]
MWVSLVPFASLASEHLQAMNDVSEGSLALLLLVEPLVGSSSLQDSAVPSGRENPEQAAVFAVLLAAQLRAVPVCSIRVSQAVSGTPRACSVSHHISEFRSPRAGCTSSDEFVDNWSDASDVNVLVLANCVWLIETLETSIEGS